MYILKWGIDKSEINVSQFQFDSKEAAKESILYHYKHGFSGFAAVLTASQAKVIAGVTMLVNCELCFPSVEKACPPTVCLYYPFTKNLLQASMELSVWFPTQFSAYKQPEAGIFSM